MAVSEAQKRAMAKYRAKNREKVSINNCKNAARTFVRHHATQSDMDELLEIFKNENKNYKK